MKNIDLKMFSLISIFFVTISKIMENFLSPLFISIASQITNENFSKIIFGPIFFFLIMAISKKALRDEYKIKSIFQLIKVNKILTIIIILYSYLINFGSLLILNNFTNSNFFIEILIIPILILILILYFSLSVYILFFLIDKISDFSHF